MARFSIDESIKFGFNITKKNFLFFLGVIGIYIAFSIADLFFTPMNDERDVVVIIVSNIILYIVGLWIGLGMLKVFLLFASKKKAHFKDIFSLK